MNRSRSPRRRRLANCFESLEGRHLLAGDPVLLVEDQFPALENGPESLLDVLANDQFADDYDGPRQITAVSFPDQGGSVEVTESRDAIRYRPPADFSGSETFVYFVDGRYSAEVRVLVQSPLSDDEYSLLPDGAEHRLAVLENDQFWPGYEGDRRITRISGTASGADLRIADDGRAVIYSAPDYATADLLDRFTYMVDDRYLASVTMQLVNPAERDEVEVLQNSSGNPLDVLRNDALSDNYPYEGRITAAIPSNAASVVEIDPSGHLLFYTPAEDFSGTEFLRYVIDGRFEATTAVWVQRPVRDDQAEVDANSTAFFVDVLANDRYRDRNGRWRDVVERVTSATQSEAGGSVEVLPDGSGVLYTPPADFVGTDTFSYVAEGRYPATVYVIVSRPVRDDYVSVLQDGGATLLPILENDFLGNGYQGSRQITDATAPANGGSVVILPNGRGLLYTPAALYVGQDTLTYTVDGSFSASVSVSVQPRAQSDYVSACALTLTHRLNVLANDDFQTAYSGPGRITSVESSTDGARFTIIDGGTALRFEGSGTMQAMATYTVDDTYTSTVRVTLSGFLQSDSLVLDQNSDPVAINVLGNDFGPPPAYGPCRGLTYGGPRQITRVDPSQEGATVRIAEDGRSVIYEPPADFFGTDQFNYVVDNRMSASVTVHVIRRVADDQYRVAPGQGETLTVLANDLFGADYSGPRQITALSPASSGGSLAIGDDGRTIAYQPPADFAGEDTFAYTVDGKLKATVTVHVQPGDAGLFPTFDTGAAYEQFLLDQALQQYESLFGQPATRWLLNEGDIALSSGPIRQTEADHSQTNVQVAGIDEPDIVEFDSGHIYSVTGRELVITDALPADQLQVLSRTEIDGSPFAEFLDGNRLAVLSRQREYVLPLEPNALADAHRVATDDLVADVPWPLLRFDETTIVTVLDVSNRAAPVVVQKLEFEGTFVDARAVDGRMFVVLSHLANPPLPLTIPTGEPADSRWGGDTQWVGGVYETKEQYIERFRTNPGSFVQEALPDYRALDGLGNLAREGLLHEPEDIYRPIDEAVGSLVSVVSIDMGANTPGLQETTGVYTRSAAVIYASREHLFVFQNDYDLERGPTTDILQFDWDTTSGRVNFVATGTVAGSMINQFSADEYAGTLRVATTVHNSGSGNWSGRAENELFVLAEDGGVLEVRSSLQNLSLGQSIRSVRFFGDNVLVSTFANVDPILGVDLSDPLQPRLLGHVSLPGMVSYMQFIGDHYLLTVGQSTPDGRSGPAQVALFDVSDFSRPRLVDEYTFAKFSRSEAAVDHHAFGYFPVHKLLAIPSSRGFYERVDSDGDGIRESRQWVTEYTLQVFRVDLENGSLQWAGEHEHDTPVRRSGYIGEVLYSVADDSIQSAAIAAPEMIVGSVAPLRSLAPNEQPPVLLRLDVDQNAQAATIRRDLAQRLDIGEAAALIIAREPAYDGSWSYIARVDDQYYLYRVEGDRQELLSVTDTLRVWPEFAWTNTAQPADVNADGEVRPSDAIALVLHLQKQGEYALDAPALRQIPPPVSGLYWDVDANGRVDAMDLLTVVQWLNDTDQTDIAVPDTSPETIDQVFAQVLSLAGDANQDGQFDSADLIAMFQAGEYEDDRLGNSTWAEGDFTGDGDFDSADLLLAFKQNRYRA